MKNILTHLETQKTVHVGTVDSYQLNAVKLLEDVTKLLDGVDSSIHDRVEVIVTDRSLRLQYSTPKSADELLADLERMKTEVLAGISASYSSAMEDIARITTDINHIKEEESI